MKIVLKRTIRSDMFTELVNIYINEKFVGYSFPDSSVSDNVLCQFYMQNCNVLLSSAVIDVKSSPGSVIL